jgi:peptide/nickel transport system substrate-binding protein
MGIWKGAVFAAAIMASGLGYGADRAVAADPFRLALGQDAVSLDPIATSDNTSIWVQLLLFDTLVRPTPDATGLEPGLAESWEISDDGLAYTFRLRDAAFSDGTPVTAEDVVYSLQRAQSEASRWRTFFKAITGLEALDEKTVVVRLDKPFTPLLNNLALFSSAILPKAAIEDQGEAFFDQPVGTGPFVLEAWNRGQSLDLAANSNYWQHGKPQLEEVELQVIPEGNSRVLKLQAGEIDAAIDIPLNQLERLGSTQGVKAEVAEVFRSEFALMNTKREPFDDIRVRQALNYAVDKEGLLQGLLFGTGSVAASPMPPMAYSDPDLQPYGYDPGKAKALLAEAGYGDGFSTTILVGSGNALHRQLGQVLQSYFSAVGVTADIQLVEGGTLWTTTQAGNFDVAVSYATSDTIDPDQLVGFLLVNPERANAYHTEWQDERVNELYELERGTQDGPQRAEMFREIVQRGHDGAPSIFLLHPGAAYAYRENVEGFRVLPTSNFRLEDVIVK